MAGGSSGQPRLCPPPPRPIRSTPSRGSRCRGRFSRLATLSVLRGGPHTTVPPPLLRGRETHTMGPRAVSCFSSLRTPSRPVAAGSPSCCPTAGKTPCGLLSAMQLRTMVLLPASSSCRGRERYAAAHLSLPLLPPFSANLLHLHPQIEIPPPPPTRGTPCSRAGRGSDRPFSRSRGLRRCRGFQAGARQRVPAGTAG